MSRTIWLVSVAVVAVLVLIVFRSTQDEKNLSAPETKQQAAPDDSEFQNWHEFTAPSGDFKVLLPALPQHAAETLNDPKTKESRQYDMYVSEKANGSIFMISMIRLLGEVPEKLDENMLPTVINDMMAASPKSKLKAMQMGRFKDYPAIEFSFENEQVSVDGKAFIAGSTLFLLTSVAKQNDRQPQEFNFFTNSFQLLKK